MRWPVLAETRCLVAFWPGGLSVTHTARLSLAACVVSGAMG